LCAFSSLITILYHFTDGNCEITTLESLRQNQGIGHALVSVVAKAAKNASCSRLWLITTNDNTHATRFYQHIGFTLCAIHFNAIEKSRKLKPQIPLTGFDDILMLHEIEFESIIT